jgi:hypothetical protein
MSLLFTLLVLGICTAGGKVVAEAIREQSNAQSWFGVWWRGALASLVIAVFTGATAGSPTCADGDPYGCHEYNDDGYEVTAQGRIDRGVDIFWKTVLGGTLGMLLLKRELERDHPGAPIFAIPDNQRAEQLAEDPRYFAQELQLYCAGLLADLDSTGSQHKSTMERSERCLKKAVALINQKPVDQRKDFADFLAKAKETGEPFAYQKRNLFLPNLTINT